MTYILSYLPVTWHGLGFQHCACSQSRSAAENGAVHIVQHVSFIGQHRLLYTALDPVLSSSNITHVGFKQLQG
jgi:hypothetical protein